MSRSCCSTWAWEVRGYIDRSWVGLVPQNNLTHCGENAKSLIQCHIKYFPSLDHRILCGGVLHSRMLKMGHIDKNLGVNTRAATGNLRMGRLPLCAVDAVTGALCGGVYVDRA